MAIQYYFNETFLFQQYQNDYQLGTGNDVDHNGVLDGKVDNIIEAIIPSIVNKKKVIRIAYKALRNVPNLQSVFIPRTIKEIRGDTFLYCHKLTTVVFEENSELKIIKWYTFYETNISSITFPSSVVSIDYKTFYKCTNLKSVFILGFLFSNYTDLFEEASKNVNVYVPINYPWDNFGGHNVIKLLPDYHKQILHFTCKQRLLFHNLPFIHLTIICIGIFIYKY